MLLITLALLLTAVAFVAFSNWWIVHLSRDFVHSSLDELPQRYVAIVLGAGVYSDGSPTPALEDRLSSALALFRAEKVQRIIVSGDHGSRWYDEVNAMGRWLRERDVPEESIFLDHAGFRTLDTMERARRVFMVEDAIICTQAFHLPRAVFLARRAGIDAVGLNAERHRYEDRRHDRMREVVARTIAVVDTYLIAREPRLLGDPIPIDGDSSQTHDRWTDRP